jgi:poly(3-hydroxybutyrate) depolymerase
MLRCGCRISGSTGVALGLFGLIVAGCRSGPGPAPDPGTGSPAAREPTTPGIHERTIPGPDGQPLRFTLAVPAGYEGTRAVPLVMALHYGGNSFPPFYGRGVLELLVQPALEPLGAIIVAPDAADPGWFDEDDEARVLHLLDHVLASFAIDRKRVLCTGYSMGGAGTWYLVGRHPARFTAAIPIAGRPPSGEGAPAGPWKVPLHAIHSRRDELIPLAATEAHIATLRAQGADVQLLIVEDLTHFQTERFVDPLRQLLPWLAQVWK